MLCPVGEFLGHLGVRVEGVQDAGRGGADPLGGGTQRRPQVANRDELPDPELPFPEVDEAAVPVANQIMADQLIQDLQTLRSRYRVQPQQATKYLSARPATFDALADLARNTPTHWTLAKQARRLLGAQARDELFSYLLFDSGYLSASVEAGRIRAQEASVLGGGTRVVDWSS